MAMEHYWESHTANSFAPSYGWVEPEDFAAARENKLNRPLRVLFQRKEDNVWRVIVGHGESRFLPFESLPEEVRANLAVAIARYPTDPRPWFRLSEIEAMAPEVRKISTVLTAKTPPTCKDEESWQTRKAFERIGWRANVDYYCVVMTVRDLITIRGIPDGNTRIESEGKSEADTC
jgi:hypothetical protein